MQLIEFGIHGHDSRLKKRLKLERSLLWLYKKLSCKQNDRFLMFAFSFLGPWRSLGVQRQKWSMSAANYVYDALYCCRNAKDLGCDDFCDTCQVFTTLILIQ